MPIETYSISELFPRQRSISLRAKPSTISISDAFREEEDDFVQDEESTLVRLGKSAAATIKNVAGRTALSLVGAEIGAVSAAERALGFPETYELRTLDWARKEIKKRSGTTVFPYSKAAQEAEKSDEWYKSPAWIAEHTLDAGADLVAAVGMTALVPGSGLAYMAGKAGGLTMGDAYDRMVEKGYDSTTSARLALGEGAIVSATVGVMNKPGMDLLTKTPAAKKTLMGIIGQRAARTTAVGGAEAFAEIVEGSANDLTQWAFENDPEAFKGFLGRRAKEGVIGFFGGEMAAGLRIGAETAFADRDMRKIDQFATQVESIMQKPGGPEGLAKLSSIANPTRKDFKDAGFRLNLSTDQRETLVDSLRAALPETTDIRVGTLSKTEYEQQTLDEAITEASKTLVEDEAAPVSAPAAAVEPTPAAAVEPTPAVTVRAVFEPGAEREKAYVAEKAKLIEPKLPHELSKAAPRYRHFSVEFESDVDRALYIAAQAKPSKRDADYIRFATKVLGVDEPTARSLGMKIKDRLKAVAKSESGDKLVLPPQIDLRPVDETAYLKAKARDEAIIGKVQADFEAEEVKRKAKKKRPAKTPLLPPLVTEEEGSLDVGALVRVATGGSVQGAKAIVGGRLGKLISKNWRAFTGQVRSRGNLEKGSFAALEKRNFRIKTEMKMVGFAVQKFRKAAHKAYGVPLLGELDADTKDTIRSVLRGEESIDILPAEVREPVRAMRKHVDALSRELVNSGAVEGMLEINFPEHLISRTELYDDIRTAIESGEPNAFNNAVQELVSYGIPEKRAATLVKIIANDGAYLTTAYDAFLDPNWSERMPRETFNDFVNWLRGEHPDWTEVDARNDANRILLEAKKAGSPLEFLARGFIPAKDLDGLKHKKNLPEVWRKFLGERDDPILNYLDSVQRIAQLNATHQMYTEMRADGLAKGYFFDPKEGKPPEGMYAQIAAPTNEGRYPLSGLVTYPEVAEAFAAADKTNMDASWYKALMFASSVSELGKTAGSPMATIRQLPSNMLSELSNGHNPLEFATMIGVAWTNLFNTDNSANQEYLLKAISRGVVGENLDLGTIEDRATQGLLSEAIRELTGGKFQTGLRKLISLPSRLYGTMDDIFKLANWEATMRDFRKAYPEWTEEQLMDEAAKVTRNTTTMYSRIPPVLRSLKRSPLGNFISFESEQIRNQWYRAGYTIKWLADPRTRFMGAKLAAGQIAARAIPLSLAALSRFLTHTSKEEEEALRGHVPWWSRYATLIHLGTDDEGIRSYVDMSFTDPLSFAVESANAAKRGDIWGALGAFFSSYGEPKILFKALDEARQGETYEKRTIYNQQDDELMKFWLGVQHVMNTALEPGIVTSGKRIARGIRPTSEEEGKRYKLKNEVAALTTGVRLTAADPRQSTSFKVSRFQNEMSETNGIFNSVANRTGAVSQSELESAYERTERNRREAFDVMAKNVQGMLTLLKGYNFDEKDAQKILEDNGVAKAMTAALLKNEYQPYIPSSLTSLDKMLQVATPEHKNLLEAKRDDVIGTMVQTASRPVETEKTRVTVENALAELDANGVGIQQGIESLWRKLLADDQESENEEAEKRGEIPRKRAAPRSTIARRRSLQRLGVDQETITRFFNVE